MEGRKTLSSGSWWHMSTTKVDHTYGSHRPAFVLDSDCFQFSFQSLLADHVDMLVFSEVQLVL